MKLLKKIAPFAISALMLGATLGSAAALNIADWKTQFKADNTAVVVGTGVTDAGDIAAALHLAQAVGIDTNAVTIGGESYSIEKSSNKFNLGNNFTDIVTSIDDDEMGTILAEATYSDAGSSEFEYTQDLTFATNNQLTLFADSSYDDKEPTLGFRLAPNTALLNYTLDFRTNPDWDDADLETTTIEIMGRNYYISDVGEAAVSMTLLDASETTTVAEGASTVLGGKTIKVIYIGSTPNVKLEVDGKTSNSLAEGATYNLGGGKYVAVKDIMYVAKDTGTSQVELAVGNGKIDIVNGEAIEINDDDVDDIIGWISNTTTLASITLQWIVEDETFITEGTSLTMPGFETISLGITGFTFPKEETIKVAGSDTTLELTVPITSGEVTIPLLYLNASDPGAYFAGLGSEAGSALKTSAISYLVFNDSADDEGFIASWVSGEESETYYLQAETYGDEDEANYTKVKDLVTGDYVCEDVEEGDTCDVSSNLVLTAGDINLATSNEFTNFTAGTGVNFYKIYTTEGLLIYAPYDSITAGHGSINISNTTVLTTYTLKMVEEDKDGTLAGGDWINVTAGVSSNYKVSVTAIASDWLGGNYRELQSEDDTYVGYVWSDLGTLVSWDTSADEDWAVVTYHGDESYGNVYIAAGTPTSGTSWAAISDSEASLYTGKNIVVIGGTAVNKVARAMLGLSESTPVYGDEAGWITNTNVDAAGKAILWLKDNPYGTTGKYALLVAGYTGSDTEKAGNFLTLGTLPAEEKTVLDTAGTVAVKAS